jgi:ubiquinone/menaquinone biosynthesis C-methylase UbiE
VDRQPEMIDAAIRQTRDFHAAIDFAVSDLDAETKRRVVYDVVSASSLLTVLPDPKAGLAQLAALAKPEGAILIVEASSRMTPINAMQMLAWRRLGERSSMLLVWAMARMGRTPLALTPFNAGLTSSTTPLLAGLVEASILRKSQI